MPDIPIPRKTAQIETVFIDPGKPSQSGSDESFKGKFSSALRRLALSMQHRWPASSLE
jgi:hypothetical protein